MFDLFLHREHIRVYGMFHLSVKDFGLTVKFNWGVARLFMTPNKE